MRLIEEKTFDEERALYGIRDVLLRRCSFAGPADGESAIKECAQIAAQDCFFDLRYPLWHVRGLRMAGCELTPQCRAALWYSEDISIQDCKLHGIKALRECDRAALTDCHIVSPEFGWSSRQVTLSGGRAESEYFFLRGEDLKLQNVNFQGKYSFQYVKNMEIDHCKLVTKDAFWHAENVTVRDSLVQGEYLAWYSKNLTLIHCKIVGTQPLCYCEGLKLIDCEMVDTDLSFERSHVEASITSPIVSVKNPRSGTITAPEVGELIMDDPEAKGRVVVTGA